MAVWQTHGGNQIDLVQSSPFVYSGAPPSGEKTPLMPLRHHSGGLISFLQRKPQDTGQFLAHNRCSWGFVIEDIVPSLSFFLL